MTHVVISHDGMVSILWYTDASCDSGCRRWICTQIPFLAAVDFVGVVMPGEDKL